MIKNTIIAAVKVIKGNAQINIMLKDLVNLISKYKKVHIDIGTGDGRFVYKNALRNDEILYIGVDPSQKQLEIYSKKAQKDKLENTLFVLGSVEFFPEELFGIAQSVSVLLPWGTLLKGIVFGDASILTTIQNLFNPTTPGELEIIFGYTREAEPSEVERLNLENLRPEYVRNNIAASFLRYGFEGGTITTLTKEDLFRFDTTWAKRLTFGQDRPVYYLKFTKNISN